MAACAHDIVARMDADDIAVPRRFEVQVPAVEAGADLVGSSLLEFGESPEDIVGRRVPPLDPAEIVRYSRFHQPFNHPTIVYRRSAVQAVGGYRSLPLMEDYLLFAKMIQNGARVANIAEPLVLYRVGAGAYARRGGVTLLKSEWALQRRLYGLGFTTRGPVRPKCHYSRCLPAGPGANPQAGVPAMDRPARRAWGRRRAAPLD